jgi:hypothetical protein
VSLLGHAGYPELVMDSSPVLSLPQCLQAWITQFVLFVDLFIYNFFFSSARTAIRHRPIFVSITEDQSYTGRGFIQTSRLPFCARHTMPLRLSNRGFRGYPVFFLRSQETNQSSTHTH